MVDTNAESKTTKEPWPAELIAALHSEADAEWGYDWERPQGIAAALDAIERVCPQAGMVLRAWRVP